MTRHPPFRVAEKDGAWRRGKDYMSELGAHRLAAIIRDAWAKAGHDIRVEVVPPPYVNGPFTVRMPTLVRGMPVKQVPA